MLSIEDLVSITIVESCVKLKEDVRHEKGFDCVLESFPSLGMTEGWLISDFNRQEEANSDGEDEDPNVPPENPSVVTSENKSCCYGVKIKLNLPPPP